MRLRRKADPIPHPVPYGFLLDVVWGLMAIEIERDLTWEWPNDSKENT